MTTGYLCIILHFHLPFVRHPEDDEFLEETWFYEALTESYIPLLRMFERLRDDGARFRVTVSISPPLLNMMRDDLLRSRYIARLDKSIDLAEKEVWRTRNQPRFNHLALMYRENLIEARRKFVDDYKGNVIGAFRRLQDDGVLEIMASAATHGYLPLLGIQRESVEAQVEVGVATYRDAFGRQPSGFWLPECGYSPPDDEVLVRNGIRYTILETHGVLHASVRPRYGVYAPILCPSGLAVFGRDVETSKQVWSMDEGYPGDFWYRDFYRDIGYDLDLDYIRDYIHKGKIRTHTGFKYYRITHKGDHKEPYQPEQAFQRADEHAGNFLFNRQNQIRYLGSVMDRPPIVVAPYDAELFGHWWFEGPAWLDLVIRKLAHDQDEIVMITPSDYLEAHPRNQVALPSTSSWGFKGYNEVWLEGSNDWIYRHIHKAADRMIELANGSNGDEPPIRRRALNQAARELLLAQASDWPFILKAGTMTAYAKRRIQEHVLDFTRLYEGLKKNEIDEAHLTWLETKDNIFPQIIYDSFRSRDLAR